VLLRALLWKNQVLDNRTLLPDKRTQITWKILKNSSALMCVFLKLFVHELPYKFIDSIDLKCCIGHWFTHPKLKNGFNMKNKYYSNFKCSAVRALAFSGLHWRALACSVVLWRALSCSGVLCRALSCSGVLWCPLACNGVLWFALACTGVLWRALAWSSVLWRALACSGVRWRALACSGVLCYA
jgi:hypothetical protein